jgi:hypothetical protein
VFTQFYENSVILNNNMNIIQNQVGDCYIVGLTSTTPKQFICRSRALRLLLQCTTVVVLLPGEICDSAPHPPPKKKNTFFFTSPWVDKDSPLTAQYDDRAVYEHCDVTRTMTNIYNEKMTVVFCYRYLVPYFSTCLLLSNGYWQFYELLLPTLRIVRKYLIEDDRFWGSAQQLFAGSWLRSWRVRCVLKHIHFIVIP